jgi:ERCC4-type nuclease
VILIDTRVGSKDLIKYFPKHLAQLTKLEFADAAFIGYDREKKLIPVGIEVKKIDDLLACMTDGRFAGHQLPGLRRDYQHVWLIVEGAFRGNRRTGVLEIPHGRGNWVDVHRAGRTVMFRELISWLTTMTVVGGVHVHRTHTRMETSQVIWGLYTWWDKEFTSHNALHVFNTSGAPSLYGKPGLIRRLAKELEGIGWGRSGAVAKHFDSVLELVTASEKEWQKIEGIGKTTAKKVVRELQK